MSVQVRIVRVEVVVDLRHRVLRAGLPRESALFAGDELETTRHFAAMDEKGKVVGCLSLVLNEREDERAYQLRGMATDDAVRGSGVGKILMEAAEGFVRGTEMRVMWCNGCKGAIGFYKRMGWAVVSEEFEIATAGVHVVMARRLE